VGNFTCALGHLGALCESCDIEQVMGGEKWSNSDLFTCGLCSETSFNTIKLILISFYNILMLFLSVKSTMTLISMYVMMDILHKLGAGAMRLD